MDTSITNLPYPSVPSMRPLKGLQPRLALAASSSPKPRLSLNTTTCPQRTLGRGSTGLRLDTLNVTSPTAQNTYRNVYDTPTSTPSLESDAGSASTPFPHSKSSNARQDRTSFPAPTWPTSPAAPNPTTILSPTLPYEQPPNLRSILRNRPIVSGRKRPKRGPQFVAAAASLPRLANPSQPLEHESARNKRVCFQQPLSVDIETSVYVLKHSDLPSRSPSPSPIVTSAVDEEDVRRPGSSSSSLSTSSTDDSADSSPATPVVTQFRKREREWVWTLGPIERGVGVENDSKDSGSLRKDEEDEEDEGPAHKKSMLAIDIFDRQ